MGGKKVNKNHPDFEDYRRKFDAICSDMKRDEEQISKTQLGHHGQDGPISALDKIYHKKIVDLQREYAHLFS